jgi:acetolactate synthase-1/3 small subunit
MNQHILAVLVNNHPGLLSKVAGLFSRRSFNIESLAVGVCEVPDCSRITIVVNGDESMVDQVIKQLDKLVDVLNIERLPQGKSVQREMILIKVQAESTTRAEVVQIAEIFRAKIVDIANTNLCLELTGQADKIEAFIKLLEPFQILQIVRTGLIAMPRG